jgi:hypothetical protein
MAREATGRSKPLPAVSLLALALGAAAFGAVAIGALAVGRLAVGRLDIKKARINTLEVDELTVRRLRVVDHDEPSSSADDGARSAVGSPGTSDSLVPTTSQPL